MISATFKFLLFATVFFSALTRAEVPPAGTWEAWIWSIRKDPSKPVARPDSKNLSLELPLWVDCHLSWFADRPSTEQKIPLPKEIVLRSDPEQCEGHLETWAPITQPKKLPPKKRRSAKRS